MRAARAHIHIALGTILLLASSDARGGGIEISAHAARATGQGDAYVAQADAPPAVFYNPGGLPQIEGTQLTSGLYTVFSGFEFQGTSGNGESNEQAYIPHFYAVTDAGLDRWRFGLAANAVFGFAEDWGDNSPLRQVVTHDDVVVRNFAPTLAYRIDEQWSLGAGLNIYQGDLELNNRPTLPGIGSSAFRFQGDDIGVGGTLGVLWRPSEQHSLGLVYRSPFSLDFDGSAVIYPPAGPAVGPSDAQANLEFPQVIVLGYAYRPVHRLKLEADVQWTDWETLDRVSIHSSDPRLRSLPPIAFDWNASWTYRVGAQYELDRSWAVRAGYIYSQSASPDETFSAAIVDLDSHIFALGVGYSQPKWAVELAYRYILGVDRTINQSVNSPPGEYSDTTHAVMLSLTWRF